MRTSRTSPTKLATAPVFVLREIARTSAPRSKSSRWMETFIRPSPAEKTRFHRRLSPWRPVAPCPGSRPRAHCAPAQILAQRADGVDSRWHLELLARRTEALAKGSKEQHSHFQR